MATVSNQIITKNGTRGTFSWDPESLAVASSFTNSDGEKYTQNLDNGNFFKSDGTWLGAEDQLSVKQAFGQSANLELGDPKLRKDLMKYADGLNVFENPGGASAGDSGDGGTPETMMDGLANLAGARKQHRNYGHLRYPLELFDTDFMRITQFKYEPLASFKQVGSQRERRADRRHKTSIGSVTLPIPSQLTDTNSVNWNNSSLNDLQMAGIRAGGDIMNSGAPIQAVQKIIDDGLTSLENNTGNAKTLIQSLILGQLPGVNQRPNEVLGRFAGQIINPNLELIFGGPTLRSFQYSFRLTPRNNKETQAVRSIIRFFKQGMSIKENPTNLFLSAPNVFQPRFYNKEGRQHTFINTIKKCACTSFTVNYVPDNTFMTLPNSSMTAYQIGMTFQEMDPIIDQDYAELDNNQDDIIGF